MQTRIRRAVPGDAVSLAGLRYAFRAEMEPAPERREPFVERCSRWMEKRLVPGSDWVAWLAEGDGSPLGCLWLQLIEKVPNPAPELEMHAYITSVFVAPEARRVGTGAGLMEAALAYCREQGVDSVVLWPSARSRTLYARSGFETPPDMMELVLDDGRTLGRT